MKLGVSQVLANAVDQTTDKKTYEFEATFCKKTQLLVASVVETLSLS